MVCQYCNEGEGVSVYPYYGLAPHNEHQLGKPLDILPKEQWPNNFVLDERSKGLAGTYTHCLHCGEPKDDQEVFQVKHPEIETDECSSLCHPDELCLIANQCPVKARG